MGSGGCARIHRERSLLVNLKGRLKNLLVRAGIVVKIPPLVEGFFPVRGILVTRTKAIREFQFPNQLKGGRVELLMQP